MSSSHKTQKGTIIPIMDIKGKPYLQVPWRILWFREEHPDWSIQTEPIQLDANIAIFKASILNTDGRVLSTAHKSETPKGFPDYIEKAETGAIGRSLALCGYGTQFTGDELDEGERLADAPIERKPIPQPTIKSSPNAEYPKCKICGYKMIPSKLSHNLGEMYCPNYKKHNQQDDLPF